MRRIQSRGLGLVAALEEEQVIEQAVAEASGETPVEPAAELNNAESLETELLEVQDTVEEGTAQAEQVEEATEVAESLDEYQEALESIMGQGGLDRNGAMILQIGLEQLCARVGIEPTSMPMPSMESFGGASSRVFATKKAMESVQETAKKVWEAIMAAIKRAGEWLANFWKTLTDSNHRLKARAEKLAAAARATSGEAKEKEIDNAGLAAKLHTNGKVESNFGHDFKDFQGFVATMADKVIPGVVEFSRGIVGSVEASAKDQGSEDILFKAEGMKAAYSSLGLTAGEGEGGEGVETLKSKQLLGGKALIVQLPTADGVAGAQAFAKCKTTIGLFKPALAKPTTSKLPVLATGEAAGVAEGVMEISKHIDTMRNLEKDFKSLVALMSSAAANFGRMQDNANDPGNKHAVAAKTKLTTARVVISAISTRVSNLPATFGSYALSTAKAATDYSELSLKQYAAK